MLPKGAICISLAYDTSENLMVGHTHRLSQLEWKYFLETPIVEKALEPPQIFVDRLPRALTKGVEANLTNFQILDCHRDKELNANFFTITCMGW